MAFFISLVLKLRCNLLARDSGGMIDQGVKRAETCENHNLLNLPDYISDESLKSVFIIVSCI
jgi:hypothetical protein